MTVVHDDYNKLHVGDVGNMIYLVVYESDHSTVIDISSATTKAMYFQRSDNSKFSGYAEFATDGEDGVIYYKIQDGDLTVPGKYKVQGYIELGPDDKYHTFQERFEVFENIASELPEVPALPPA